MNAAIDINGKGTLTARLNTNGLTIMRVKATASGHLLINDGVTGTPTGNNFAATDDNERVSMFAVSSSDPTVLITLLTDSSGALLVDSN